MEYFLDKAFCRGTAMVGEGGLWRSGGCEKWENQARLRNGHRKVWLLEFSEQAEETLPFWRIWRFHMKDV